MRRALGVALLSLALVATARGASERTPLEARCDELAALALAATAVDLESSGGSETLLAEVCTAFAEEPGAGEVRPEVARRTLAAAARLVDRLGVRRPVEQGAVAGFCGALAARFERPEGELAREVVAWAARAVRVACLAGVDDERVALALATRLDGARSLADEAALRELRDAAGLLLAQGWFELAGGMREEILDRLTRVGLTSEGTATALARVTERLGSLAGSKPDADALAGALGAALAVRGIAPEAAAASLGPLVTGILAPLPLRVAPVERFVRGKLAWSELLDDWSAVRDGRRARLDVPGGSVGMSVLADDGRLLALPAPASLGLDGPWVLPGLTYVLTLHGTRDVRLVVETGPGAPAPLSVPVEVPDDALLVRLRLDSEGSLRVVRASPWTRLEWLAFLQRELRDERPKGPAVDLFAGIRFGGAASDEQRAFCNDPDVRARLLDEFRADPASVTTLVVDAERGELLRAIRTRGDQYLELLRLPEGRDAPRLLELLRALSPGAFDAAGELLTSDFLTSTAPARGAQLTCDAITLTERDG